MLNDPRTLYRRFALGTAGLTALAALLRTLSLCLYFDRSVGYVDANAFSTLLYIASALFVLGCIAYVILATRLEKTARLAVAPNETAITPAVRYTALLCALTFVGAMVAELLLCGFDGTFPLLRYLAAIIATLYFVSPNKKGPAILSGLGVLLYAVCAIASEYFDWTVTLNSPIKLMQEASLLSSVFFILVEMNHLNHTRRSIRYTICAAFSLFLGVVGGLPLIAASLVGGIVKPEYLIHSLPPLAIALYAAARLFASHEIDVPAPVEETQDEQAPSEKAADEQIPDTPDTPTLTSREEETNG